MSLENMKRIVNNTNVAQSIVWRGVQVALSPHEERLCDAGVAEAFVERSCGLVAYANDDFGEIYVPPNQPTQVWVANMTGNPDAPDKIEVRVWKDKQWQFALVDNPIKAAFPLSEYANGTQLETIAPDGVLEFISTPGKYVTIPPYKRLQMDETTAAWFINRSTMSSPRTRTDTLPKCIVSRPRSNFEPDPTWTLADLNAYMTLIDPDCPKVRDEDTIRKQNKRKSEEEIKLAMDTEKRLALKRLYFRLVNPSYRLPTRAEFEEFVKGPKAVEEECAAADQELVDLVENAAKSDGLTAI